MRFEDIRDRILSGGEALTEEEGVYLFQKAHLLELMTLANELNVRRNGHNVLYNINAHINPTNVCVLSCRFCSFSRKPGEEGAFALSHAEIQQRAVKALSNGATEVHLVGGLHPRWRYQDMLGIVTAVKEAAPALHVKAYTAVEIDWMARRSRKHVATVLEELKQAGLDSIPGGGAEIFHPDVRKQICDTKVDAQRWLEIHRLAHNTDLRSNATMLYGHIESPMHRMDHMRRLRELQEETKGFNVFIPLAFQPLGNDMGIDKYTDACDDLRTIAIARIYLHNFANIKSYWVMLGREVAQLALLGGANDFDGTVEDEKISRMAGGKAGKGLAKQVIVDTITTVGRVAVERDSLYNMLESPRAHDSVFDLLAKSRGAVSESSTSLRALPPNTLTHRLLLEPSMNRADILVVLDDYFATTEIDEKYLEVIAPETGMDFMTFLLACVHCRQILGDSVALVVALDRVAISGDSAVADKLVPLLAMFAGVSYFTQPVVS